MGLNTYSACFQARCDRDAAVKQLEKAARRNEVTLLEAPADAIVLDVAQRSVASIMKEAEPLYTLVSPSKQRFWSRGATWERSRPHLSPA